MRSFLFDTYAFHEIIVGNPCYEPYKENVKIVTTQLNLMELYYHLLRMYSKEVALELFRRYEELTIPITNQDVLDAMDFRYRQRKRKLSYVDCIGYSMAKKNKWLFLTGDKQFEDLPHVEFVK